MEEGVGKVQSPKSWFGKRVNGNVGRNAEECEAERFFCRVSYRDRSRTHPFIPFEERRDKSWSQERRRDASQQRGSSLDTGTRLKNSPSRDAEREEREERGEGGEEGAEGNEEGAGSKE